MKTGSSVGRFVCNRDTELDWVTIRQGFVDELEKISEFNLSGLSPENVMKGSTPPPPMETVGFQKARDILGKAQMSKTSGSKQVQRAHPTRPGMQKLVHQGDDSKSEQAKSVAGYSLAGLGTGKALTSDLTMASPWARRWHEAGGDAALSKLRSTKIHDAKWAGTAVGTLGGLAYGLHRQRVKAKQRAAEAGKTKTSMTPATALKSSKQVASPIKAIKQGPSLKTQTPGRIGIKGSLP